MTLASRGGPLPAFDVKGDGGIPIVFLHGIGGGADSWSEQLSFFGVRRQAIAWWMPGYGPSSRVQPMTFDALADSAIDVIDSLGARRVHLVGHSIGGMIAQTLAGRPEAQSRLASLCLSATSPAFGNSDGSFQRDFIAKRLAPLDRGFSMADMAPGLVAELVAPSADKKAIRLAEASMSAVPPAIYRDAMHCVVRFDARSVLPKISIPVLVLAGEHDTNAPAPMMQRMATKIPNARFRVIGNAGHLSNMERPDEFNEALSSFLDDVEATGGEKS